MSKTRMEAFSDGVVAILITIMVLELKVPHGADLASLRPTVPIFLTYVLSYVMLGIYWNNHHHMLQATDHVNGKILWANLNLLFWLSLIPFVTGWMGENHLAPLPTAVYGVVMICAGVSYTILQTAIVRDQKNGRLKAAVGKDFKGKLSMVLYSIAIPSAFLDSRLAVGIYVLNALVWLVPDRRIESRV
jgi:TMEM175 potassium channel family protein